MSRTEPEADPASIHPLTGEGTEKVLGIVWDAKADLLGFKVNKMLDPLGTALPFIVKGYDLFESSGSQRPWMDGFDFW